MKIRLIVDGQSATATLYDNATARDFATLLPLSLTMEDYATIERVSSLPRKLSTQGAPDGMAPVAGELTHYAPWGNLAISSRADPMHGACCRWARWRKACPSWPDPGRISYGSSESGTDASAARLDGAAAPFVSRSSCDARPSWPGTTFHSRIEAQTRLS